MAYDRRQQSIIAYALALSGLNVRAAARWLEANSAEVGQASDSTIRRLLKDEAFHALVEEQSKVVRQEQEAATRAAERERLQRELRGTFAERLAAMEANASDLMQRIHQELSKPEADGRLLIRFWDRLQAFVQKARAEAPVISETWQVQAVIDSMKTVLGRKAPELASSIMAEWLAEYRQRVTSARGKAETEATGEELSP